MNKFLFFSVALTVATIGETILSFKYFQLFPLLIVIYYITFQRGWKTAVLYAIFFGMMTDTLFPKPPSFYLIYSTLVVIPIASYWRKNGDHTNPVARVVPIIGLVLVASLSKIFILSQGEIVSHLIYSLPYPILSATISFIASIFIFILLDDFAKSLGLPTYILENKSLN